MKTKYHSAGGLLPTITAADMKNSVVMYEISRYEIENGLTERLVHDLRVDPENPLIQAGIGSVIFMVTGYDIDSRELYDIPEFVAYIRKANEATPCWIYYAAPESYWLQTVVFCISKSAYVSGSRPGFRTLAFSPYEAAGFLDRQLDDCLELSIIGNVTEKKSREHLKLVFAGFSIDLP
ncbi:MAG: hypothetical protein WCO94_08085 [Verrucomicrobiota bacterium]